MVVQQLLCVNEGMCQSLERNVLASDRKRSVSWKSRRTRWATRAFTRCCKPRAV